MKIPKANAWQYLRSLCLDAIPSGASAYHIRATPLEKWRLTGSFRLLACAPSLITLEAADVEVGTALLADSEYLLDHAAEQRAMVRRFVSELTWNSPAWAAVTVYYWAFFSTMAITRLAGRTTWFLDRTALTEFRRLANAPKQPYAGAWKFSIAPYVSANVRGVTLEAARTQLHDAHWKRFHNLVADAFSQCDQNANPLEYRLFWCMHEAQRRLGPDWPSSVRNIVNYRPGRAYREVIGATEIDAAPYIRSRSPLTSETLISSLEDTILRFKPTGQVPDDVASLCRLLVLFSAAVAGLSEGLHADILHRSSTDRRWLDLRTRFLRTNCAGNVAGTVWPFAAEI